MFSWDASKALKNYEKHGITFEEATTVFGDPEALDWEDLDHLKWNGAGSVLVFRLRAASFFSYTRCGD